MSETASPSLPAGRRAVFYLIALVLPAALLLLVEGALRVAGYGRDYPLFITHPQQPEYLLANPDVLRRYFPVAEAAPTMAIETVYFAAQRPEQGLRLVVQGGSSAAGFPYGLGGSLSGMLEQRLRRVHPHRPIEVINTAMSAVNSYTLLDFADEIIALEPDAVLIYAGHNEFLGIMGVGSAFLGGNAYTVTRAFLWLRDVRLFQLLQSVYLAVAPQRPAVLTAAERGGTMMSKVAKEKHIAYGSPLYRRGAEQFRRNLDALLRRYRQAQIPVYIGTLASNERDQPPFTSGLTDGTDPAQWEQALAAARAALAAGEADRALTLAGELVERQPRAAAARFLLARVHETRGDALAARRAYREARDRDELRFRAPGEFNETIAALAAEHGATVVEVERRFAAASPPAGIGAELMLEHLHPNLDGYFLLADAFHDAIDAAGLAGEPLAPVSDEQARREVPVSEIDRIFARYKVALITANWPFTDEPGRPELPVPDSVPARLAQALYRQSSTWPQVHLELLRHYGEVGRREQYAHTALILADAFPFRPALQFQAGTALIEQGRHRQALNYLYTAAKLQPGNVNSLLALSHAMILNGARDQGAQVLERVLELDPDNPTAQRVLGQLRGAGGTQRQ